jgi:hypothetical protein
MTPATYWKLKTNLLQHENAMLKLQGMAAQADAAKRQSIIDAGLDPTQDYTLNDASCTVTLRPAPAPPATE